MLPSLPPQNRKYSERSRVTDMIATSNRTDSSISPEDSSHTWTQTEVVENQWKNINNARIYISKWKRNGSIPVQLSLYYTYTLCAALMLYERVHDIMINQYERTVQDKNMKNIWKVWWQYVYFQYMDSRHFPLESGELAALWGVTFVYVTDHKNEYTV